MLNDSQRRISARIAAHSLHAQRDSRELTANARAALLARFERDADPEGVLSEVERQRRAQQLKKVYFLKLALRSSRARTKKRNDASAA